MIKIVLQKPDGSLYRELEGKEGESLLDLFFRENVREIEGACEGSLACSTCHILIDPDWFKKLPDIDVEEEDMLDFAYGLTPQSRLGCQIVLTPELDGLVIRLPGGSYNALI